MIRIICSISFLLIYLSPAAQQLSAIYGGGKRTIIDPFSCNLLPNCDDSDPNSLDFCLDGNCAHSYIEGIPSGRIFNFDLYDNGELVLLTDHSIVRRSATQTDILQTSDHRIPSNWFFYRDIAPRMDASGALWIGSWVYTGGPAYASLLRWDGAQLDTFQSQFPLSNFNLEDLEIGPNGEINMLTTNEQLISYDGQNWQLLDLNSIPTLANSSMRIRQLQFDANGELWLGGFNQQGKAMLAHDDGTSWTLYQSNISVSGNYVRFLISSNDDKWIGRQYSGSALAHFNGTWTEYNSNQGTLPSGTTLFPKEGPNNKIWLPTFNNGIIELDPASGSYTSLTTQNSGNPYSYSHSVAVNPNFPDVYVSPNWQEGWDDIALYDGNNWSLIPTADGPNEEFDRAFLDLEADGNIWYRGQHNDIAAYFDGNQWQDFGFPEEIVALEVDANGGYWIFFFNASNQAQLQYYDGTTFSSIPLTNNQYFSEMEMDGNGDLWFKSYQRIWRFDGSNWTQFTSSDFGCIPRSLVADENGAIYVDCEDGSIYNWNGSGWTNVYAGTGANFYSNAIIPIPNSPNSFWQMGYQEVRKVSPAGTISYTSSNAPINSLYTDRSAVDTNGHVWTLSSSNQQLVRFDDQGYQTYEADSLGIRLDTTSHLAFDANGHLWVSNVSNVYQFGNTTAPSDTVWPGDANDDLIANYLDFLDLGIAFGSTGPARPNATINWQAEPVFSWNGTLPNGTNYAYTDTDGSGTANLDDTLAIIVNYGLTHNKSGTAAKSGATPLLIVPDFNTYQAGDTVYAPIILGLDTLLADSVYGLGFTISYDPGLVDSASVELDFANSWLGVKNQDMISFARDDFDNGQVDLALTRNDQTERTGFGQIAKIRVVMIDDISGKTTLRDTLRMEIDNVRLIRLDGTEIPYDTEPTVVEVTQEVTAIPRLAQELWQVHPNPAQDRLVVRARRSPQGQSQLKLYNLQGELVWQHNISAGVQSIALPALPNALYLLQIQNETNLYQQKLQIQR
ncbi:MAG: T9SS type A sorting domain-containing protein [Bacteroidota bacterium]